MSTLNDTAFMALAAAEAEKHIGATAPNPPVGACLVRNGRVLSVGAHKRAGSDHAEIVVLRDVAQRIGLDAARGATLYVTLEPCNHRGKTPPCTQAIIEAGIARVVFGVSDPNRGVKGGGEAALRAAGINVERGVAEVWCRDLIRPFEKWITTRTPWVVHKLAWRQTKEDKLTMLPETGAKTFTSEDSLRKAHLERKKCDAVLTTLPTILSDNPMFNVRLVEDHPNRRRVLAVVSRDQKRPPQEWCARQETLGFDVVIYPSVEKALNGLGEQGVHRVLVEAGPRLSSYLEESRLWDERLVFIHRTGGSDLMKREFSCLQGS